MILDTGYLMLDNDIGRIVTSSIEHLTSGPARGVKISKSVKILIIFVKIRLSSGLFRLISFHCLYVARLMPYASDYQTPGFRWPEGNKVRKDQTPIRQYISGSLFKHGQGGGEAAAVDTYMPAGLSTAASTACPQSPSSPWEPVPAMLWIL